MNALPILIGADTELSNAIVRDAAAPGETGDAAARALLREIPGQSTDSRHACDSQDWGRKFLLSNGGCVYIDSSHLEVCIPEVRSAYDFVAASHAMLRIVRQAQADANDRRPAGERIQVLANNSDGFGHSYGSHLNFLIDRDTWEDIFHRRVHPMLFLAAHQASSIVFAGQGKVGSENGRPAVPYQLAARADFYEEIVGTQTMFRRPLVNARDEALCGLVRPADRTADPRPGARLHVIFYDNTLCHVGSFLKVGCLQILLAMIQRGRVDLALVLDDPVDAVVAWSHDPTLQARARTASGRSVTAVELQQLFCERAAAFVESGGCEGIVPHARAIVTLWEETLGLLEKTATGDGDAFARLSRRLDWVLKLTILDRAMRQRPELAWGSPGLKHLDHLYSSLAPGEGLYWLYEKAGLVDRLVSDARIERLVHEPPEDTRAWTRAMLLRWAGAEAVSHVDWDGIRFRIDDGNCRPRYRTLDLDDPTGFTRAEVEPVLRRARDLDDVVDALGETDAVATPVHRNETTREGGANHE